MKDVFSKAPENFAWSLGSIASSSSKEELFSTLSDPRFLGIELLRNVLKNFQLGGVGYFLNSIPIVIAPQMGAGYTTGDIPAEDINKDHLMHLSTILKNTTDYTFSEYGKYIIVVWVTEDPNNYDPTDVPIIGWSVDIE